MTIYFTKLFSPIALIGIMALTRFHHFGSAFSLPDASIAVFFLAGFGLSTFGLLGLLLIEASLIDYVAITQFNVSDYCISPAYIFLIPTYAAMWFAGYYARLFDGLSFSGSLKTFGLASVATTLAYIISNGSFFMLSEHIIEHSWKHYVSQFAAYYPPYVTSSLIYIGIGLLLVKLWQASRSGQAVES